jgi:hypothetical protein
MEKGCREAPRVSPTNIGLLLNTRQAACELGFLTAPEFAALTGSTLRTIERMEKFRGHLYNWYDTETLCPLDKSPFVSSVDSGNLVASLYTLYAGTRTLVNKPLLRAEIFTGLRAYLCVLRKTKHLPESLSRIKPPGTSAGIAEWIVWLQGAQAALAAGAASAREQHRDAWWIEETLNRVDAVLVLFHGYLPWLLPQFAPLRLLLQLGQGDKLTDCTPAYAIRCFSNLPNIYVSCSRPPSRICTRCPQVCAILSAPRSGWHRRRNLVFSSIPAVRSFPLAMTWAKKSGMKPATT